METRERSVETMLQQFAMIRKVYGKLCFQSLSSYEFSPSEIDILIFLSNNQTINTAKELAFCLNISKGLIARSVESLMKRELIEVKEDRSDKRIKHVFLKDNSEGVVQQIKEQKNALAQILRKGVSDEELQVLLETMMKINKNMQIMLEEKE